jgi:ketosteroid isomerase-like protein
LAEDRIINKTCPYCQTKIKQGADHIVCPECGTPHHKECWNENRGCTTFGCKENYDVKKKASEVIDIGNQTVEDVRNLLSQPQPAIIPVTPNRKLINCPECKSLVEENSRFCKYCGYNFIDNQTPIARNEFEKEYIKRYNQRVSMQRKGAWMTFGSIFFLAIILIIAGYFAVQQVTDYTNSPREEIKTTIMSWKDAWEKEDMEKYQSYLTEDYQYTFLEGQDAEDNLLDKQTRIERIKWTFNRYRYIKIDFSNIRIDVNPTDINKAIVRLDEKYESDKYSDEGKKTLYMRKDGDQWKIYKEVFEL